MSPSEEKPKLIIDEDWKTQVEREREQLRKESGHESGSADETTSWSPDELPEKMSTKTSDEHGSQSPQTATSQPVSSQPATSQPEAAPQGDHVPPPPASFPLLVSILGTQALAAMGQLGEGPDVPPTRLDYAKHYIDLLALLEEKTKGNLASAEYDLLADWLHQLRMTYVNVAKSG